MKTRIQLDKGVAQDSVLSRFRMVLAREGPLALCMLTLRRACGCVECAPSDPVPRPPLLYGADRGILPPLMVEPMKRAVKFSSNAAVRAAGMAACACTAHVWLTVLTLCCSTSARSWARTHPPPSHPDCVARTLPGWRLLLGWAVRDSCMWWWLLGQLGWLDRVFHHCSFRGGEDSSAGQSSEG